MQFPEKAFLNRDGFPPEVQGILDRWGNLLDQVVNFGTNYLAVLDKSAEGYHDLSVLALTRHAIELLDGIAILIRRGAVGPSEPTVRGLIESTLQIEYMLKSDTVRRGIAYYVQHLHAQQEWAEKADPKTERGKQHAAILEKDASMDGFAPAPIESAPIVASIQKQLGRPEFVEVEAEWQRIRTAKPRKKVWWYVLFGGPESVEALAKTLDKHGWYEILYRIYSGGSHGSDALRGLRPKKGKGLFYQPLRYPHSATDLGSLAVSISLHLFTVLAAHYAKSDPRGISRWYVESIRNEYRQLLSIRFVEEDAAQKKDEREQK